MFELFLLFENSKVNKHAIKKMPIKRHIYLLDPIKRGLRLVFYFARVAFFVFSIYLLDPIKRGLRLYNLEQRLPHPVVIEFTY